MQKLAFPFWSIGTIQNIRKSLTDKGYINVEDNSPNLGAISLNLYGKIIENEIIRHSSQIGRKLFSGEFIKEYDEAVREDRKNSEVFNNGKWVFRNGRTIP